MWYGYIFIKWRRYYVIGKVNETELINENGLNPLNAKIGKADFDIIYFSKIPPPGVHTDSFGDTDIEIDNITDRVVKQIIFEKDVIDVKPIEKED